MWFIVIISIERLANKSFVVGTIKRTEAGFPPSLKGAKL